MTTAQVFVATAAGPAEWRSGPAPHNLPHFARTKGSPHSTFCADSWFNSAIFGKDYEWAAVAHPPAHTVKLVQIIPPPGSNPAHYS